MKIAVVGIWHLGEVVSNVLAKIGHEVVGIDGDAQKISALQQGIPPLDEPGLKELLADNLQSGKISFSNNFADVKDCESVFLTYDTPVSENDDPDTSILFEAVTQFAPFLKKDVLFVVMSQVPVGTTKKLHEKIIEIHPESAVASVYFPENLRLGQALDCFLKPDRFIVGSDSKEGPKRLEEIIKNISCPRLQMKIASAEMTKHALNAFLATSLSFTYNISDLCEEVGADMSDVSRALKSDERIGPGAYLDTSLGFSGGTLMRDLKTLSRLAKDHNQPLSVINGVLATNLNRRSYLLNKLKQIFGDKLNKSKFCVLGVTYKPGTSTLRRSMALELIANLKKIGVAVTAYDPGADKEEFRLETGFELSLDVKSAIKGCQAVIVVTAWSEFKELDFNGWKDLMSSPYLFFDTRNFFKEKEGQIASTGLKYMGLGR